MLQSMIQGLVNGLSMGWVYILMALGLSLIFGIMRIIQFAHGEIYMMGAYLAYFLTLCHVPLFIATLVSMVAMGFAGFLLQTVFFRRFQEQAHLSIIFGLGLMLILQTSAVLSFGLVARTLPPLCQYSIELLGIKIPGDRLVAAFFSIILVTVCYLFLKKTKYGLAIVACAENRQGAELQGISHSRMSIIVMSMGCALAAAGGTIAGSLLQLSPFMGAEAMVKGLIIIIFGGMGSLFGTILGGLVLGLIDGIVPILFGSAATALFPLIFVIFVLIIRPQGLFGHE